MSFLSELQAKKSKLKTTITNITYSDGTQEQISVSKGDSSFNSHPSVQLPPKPYGFVVDTKPDVMPACILDDFLYLGSQDAVSLENIHRYGVTDILSIGIETPHTDFDPNNTTVRCHFIECLDVPETRIQPLTERTNEIIRKVRDENGRILVHCNAGVSRSASVCIAYLICEHGMSFDGAYSVVKSKRECIQPNTGFSKQLKELNQLNT